MKNVEFLKLLEEYDVEVSDMFFYENMDFGFEITENDVDFIFSIDLTDKNKIPLQLMNLAMELESSNFTEDEEFGYQPISDKNIQSPFDDWEDLTKVQSFKFKLFNIIFDLASVK